MIAFARHTRTYTVPKALVADIGAEQVTGWDLLNIAAQRNADPDDDGDNDAADWADNVLDNLLDDADDEAENALDCPDCPDVGFYAIEADDDDDLLVILIRRSDADDDDDDGGYGYDQFTASGWQPYKVPPNTKARIISREVAADLASVIASGGAGLVLRYVEPLAWLPPSNDISVIPLSAAVDSSADSSGWLNYAIVDELDVGAVLNLIRLAKGPKLESFTAAGGWKPDDKLLTELEGVNPPMLVQLSDDQLTSVEDQITASAQAAQGTTAAAVSTAARKKAADKGQALPDGSFPIRNKTDLAAAIKAHGRAKNKAKVKRHIIKRARALGAVKDLPEEWGVTAGALTADGFPENQTCEYCDDPATQRIIHSEGMAYIPVCDDHLAMGTTAAESCTPDGSPDPSNIVRIDVITAASLASPLPGESPDPRAEKLRRYWSIGGRGGAKIRWGTKGDWKRCYAHLVKFMGLRAKGYCQNLHIRNTGVGTGSKLNASAMSTEEALAAAITAGAWFSNTGRANTMNDGVYTEVPDAETELLNAVVAGGFPVAPPDEWFDNPNLLGSQPITVTADGHVFGHIATWDQAHIGLPGKVHAPKSRSGYAYFKTGEVVTASGKHVPVGNITLGGGHAPLSADAGAAVAHYDSTSTAVADVNVGEDRFGIWVAGALRPEVNADQVRALRASAPSGDWRPINGGLELVAVLQVNVPGFPVARAQVASGAILALVAAGARPLAEMKLAAMANEALASRVASMEAALVATGVVAAGEGEVMGIEVPNEAPEVILEATPTAVAEAPADQAPVDTVPEQEQEASPAPVEEKQPEAPAQAEEAPVEQTPEFQDRIARLRAEIADNKRRDALRMRVHQPAPKVPDRRQALRDRVRPQVVAASGDAAPKASTELTSEHGSTE